MASSLPGVRLRLRHPEPKGAKQQAADALSRLETKEHETGKINDELLDELIIGAIMDGTGILDLDGTFDDNKPYMNTGIV